MIVVNPSYKSARYPMRILSSTTSSIVTIPWAFIEGVTWTRHNGILICNSEIGVADQVTL